jgi:RNA-binding protein
MADSAVFMFTFKHAHMHARRPSNRRRCRAPFRKERRLSELKGYQRKYLRGLAHALKPVVQVGQKGLTDAVVDSVEEALAIHELVKVKFIEHKEKDQKAYFCEIIETKTGATMVGMIGHTAIFYRPQPDPEKRAIALPRK